MKLTKALIFFSLALTPLSFAHALSLGGGSSNPDSICLVQNAQQAAKQCKNGQLMIFQPPTFGNEQFPVLITGLFCDFQSSISLTVGGVSCVFSDARKKDWKLLMK